MGMEQLRTKIEEQQAVYQALKAGNDNMSAIRNFITGNGVRMTRIILTVSGWRIIFCTAISMTKRRLFSFLRRS